MSTLKVNKLRDTAGSADAITLDPNGGAVLAGVTTVSTVKVGSGVTISSDGDVFTTGITTSSTVIVGSGVTISESGIEASGIGITCANINGTQIGGRRNIIINGAMMVAQRGTSSTTSGYGCVDRIQHLHSGTDEAPTFSQADVASGTTPYSLGFRKSIKVTNGNQTSGAGASDFIRINYIVEAQDVVNSGWDITSPSSFVTISFWVKSSVAQNFYGYFYTYDGTPYHYPYETGSLTANTWTKVVKTIPGNSNVTVDNDNGNGINIAIGQFWGTDLTASPTLNQWQAWSSSTRTPDYTSTWYTTNDATFEMTGLQLEVGSQATAFEHRSFAEEKALCQRYCYQWDPDQQLGMGQVYSGSGYVMLPLALPVEMRAKPSVTKNGSYWFVSYHGNSGYAGDRAVTVEGNNGTVPNGFMYRLFVNGGSNQGNAVTVWCIMHDDAGQYLRLESEL